MFSEVIERDKWHEMCSLTVLGCNLFLNAKRSLKIQSCKLYDNKYMITSTQITNTEIFAFISVLLFKLRKDNRNC